MRSVSHVQGDERGGWVGRGVNHVQAEGRGGGRQPCSR